MRRSVLLSAATAALALGLVSSSASAAVITFSGALTNTDPTFNRPTSTTSLSAVGTAVAYDTYTFVAGTGPYSISSDYTAGPLDGYLFLYAPTFVPATPLVGLAGADDDNDPDGAGSATSLQGSLIPSAGSYGALTTTTTLTLVPGTTYTIVQTAFDNTTVADGLGAYTITVTGAAAPEPASIAAIAISAGVLGLRRRRNAI